MSGTLENLNLKLGKKIQIHTVDGNDNTDFVEVFNEKDEKIYTFYRSKDKTISNITTINDNVITKIEKMTSRGPGGKIEIIEESSATVKKTCINNFEDGKINGDFVLESFSSQIKEQLTCSFVNGVCSGPFVKKMNESITLGHFNNGQKEGEFIIQDMEKILTTHFQKDILNGITTIKSKNSFTKVEICQGVIKKGPMIKMFFDLFLQFIRKMIYICGQLIKMILQLIIIDNITFIYKTIQNFYAKIKSFLSKIWTIFKS